MSSRRSMRANSLYGTLERLLELGALERREEPDLQYRWRSAYRVVIE
jgi:hypothetical protein